MKIAIVQHDIRENDPEGNLRHLASLMGNAPVGDMYVLSETFATGFLAQGEADESLSPRILDWMREQARNLDAAVLGSVATMDEEGNPRNRQFFVRPDGTLDYYDKRHLFGHSGEADRYVPGERRVIVEWRGVRFQLQTCYDLRFPAFFRNRGEYDVLVNVAAWPALRRDVWQLLLKARAVENQCFVVGVNRVGADRFGDYTGDSVIIDAFGNTVASCTPGREEVSMADIDMDGLRLFRSKFPVLDDADATG